MVVVQRSFHQVHKQKLPRNNNARFPSGGKRVKGKHFFSLFFFLFFFILNSVTNKRVAIAGEISQSETRTLYNIGGCNRRSKQTANARLSCTICQKLVCRPRLSLRSSTGPTETFISSSIGKCMRELRSITAVPKGVLRASGWINRRFKERERERGITSCLKGCALFSMAETRQFETTRRRPRNLFAFE